MGLRLLVVAIVALVVTACSDAESFDRERAVDDVLERSVDDIDREQARCYVDRVADELGSRYLDPDVQPGPERVRSLAAIRLDCVGAANLGMSPPADEQPEADEQEAPDEPWAYGDDAELDAWWDSCEAGDPVACDQLFDLAPLGSVYEWFGATCAGEEPRERCSP